MTDIRTLAEKKEAARLNYRTARRQALENYTPENLARFNEAVIACRMLGVRV